MASMMDLPDELIQRIIDILTNPYLVEPHPTEFSPGTRWPSDEIFLKVTMRIQKDDKGANSTNPLYHLSVVNHRIRRICSPVLFNRVCLELEPASSYPHPAREMDQFSCILEKNAHLKHFIRHIRLTQKGDVDVEKPQRFFISILASFPQLETLDISLPYRITEWNREIPVIKAANQHPSPVLCVIYPELSRHADSQNLDPIPSLSRIVVRRFSPQSSSHVPLGLRILHVIQPRSKWYQATYPGLLSVFIWMNPVSFAEDFIDFFTRHPSLRKVSLGPSASQALTPWAIKLAADLSPHRSTITGSTVIRINEADDWQLIAVKVKLMVVSTSNIADVVSKLGQGLPRVQRLTLDFEDSAKIIADLDSKSVVRVIADAFPNLRSVLLPEPFFDAILRDWRAASVDNMGNTEIFEFLDIKPFCEKFCLALAKSISTLEEIDLKLPENARDNMGFRGGLCLANITRDHSQGNIVVKLD